MARGLMDIVGRFKLETTQAAVHEKSPRPRRAITARAWRGAYACAGVNGADLAADISATEISRMRNF
jgi:hypothetical protein